MIEKTTSAEGSNHSVVDETEISVEMSQSGSDAETSKVSTWVKVKAFLLKWHLPLMLIFAVVFGSLVPTPGAYLNNVNLGGVCFGEYCVWKSVSNLSVTLIFFLSGIKLKTAEIKNAIQSWKAWIWGMLSIMLITPLISFATVHLEFGEGDAKIIEFGVGLAIFFCMPTTLSSGPIIVGQAKGNVALALLLTVFTNILGVFTSPLLVSEVLDTLPPSATVMNATRNITSDDSAELQVVSVKPVPIILQLVFSIVIPLFVGKAARHLGGARVQSAVTKHKVAMKLFSSFLLATIPWMKASASADDFNRVEAGALVATIAVGMAVHVLYLAFNYTMCNYILAFPLEEKKAVTIVTSQKTLPVALTILEFLPAEVVGNKGIVAVAMIVAHLSQIVIDGFVAAKWATIETEDDEKESAKKENTSV